MFSPTSPAPNAEDDDDGDAKRVKRAKKNGKHTKVLEGVDVTPLGKDSSGVEEAAGLGYSTKLISNWYRHTCKHNSCQARWSEFAVIDDDEEDLRLRASPIPIIHRHVYVNKHWVTDSITVQDPAMREVLTEVLRNYQDLDLELELWTFRPPFMPLVHRWDELKQYHKDAKDLNLKNAAAGLLAFLTPIVASFVLSLSQTRATGKVIFQNVWQIFPPSSFVQTKFFGIDTVCRVLKYQKREADRCNPEGWVIDMEYVDWNGETSGYATTKLTIWEFDGFRRVTSLPVFPISFLSDVEKTKSAMILRGRKFEQLRGYKFMLANGTKVLLETEKPEQRPVAAKVCVDAYAYYRSCNIVKPNLRTLFPEDENQEEEVDGDTELSDTPFETKFTVAPVESAADAKGPAERSEDLRPLTDEQCMMATPWLKGFDLKTKDWCELRVDDLKPMVWNDEAFDKLVLPGGEKDLAWSFVENKSISQTGFDDFIPDKGRGLIILMFGPPGVGKTFTAEAVAERSRVPLYSMSAGDLGINPNEVEKNLERALELCRMWNAMLLLDEADVFLGARTNESLARNELVSSKNSHIHPPQRYITDHPSLPHQARVLPGHAIPHHQQNLEHRPRVPVPSRPVPPVP